ncbi:AfsR/SARP family transcriptional regulator, partial [Nocardia otitidiscaviarum]|uniref:AfsR/SARP family transcriptional regulator n=1 Tax=Nocardia otitidiscaviarum TaxID=1823 RepID=UPI0024555866
TTATPSPPPPAPAPDIPTVRAPAIPTPEAPSAYYRSCAEARAAGAAPLLDGVLAAKARAHLYDDPEITVSLVRRALGLVHGDPMMDVALGQVLTASAVRLGEEIMAAQQLAIEAQMRLARYSEVIVELHELCGRYPLREWFHYQLMDALARTGRRVEALEVYAELQRQLRGELGIDPSQSFQRLHMQILSGADDDPGLPGSRPA